ncbi:MAG: serine/threonine-protein phosphatase [Desulfobacterales bacterium]|nr:MAG: serine/threonine-protein phosphatase [Desulfobacterales bacterium]
MFPDHAEYHIEAHFQISEFNYSGSKPSRGSERKGRTASFKYSLYIYSRKLGNVAYNTCYSLSSGLSDRPDGLSDVNRQIAADVEESGQFMTLFYLVVNKDSRCLEWVRAGHDPGIFHDPERDLFENLAGQGLALGIDSQWHCVTNRKEGLKEGQIIVLGTDGIWEAQNPQGEMFGKEAICRIIRENPETEANALLDVIIDSLDDFRDGFSLQDDVTLIVVKIGKT